MKGSRRKQKAIAVAVFGLFLVGLSCYWLRNDDSASAGNPRPRSVQPVQTSSGDPRNVFFRADPAQIPSGFGYGALSPEARNHISGVRSSLRNESLSSLNELNISGTSQNAAELMQEVTARSTSKAEAFSHVSGLAARHADARIREQAVTSLAEVPNDLTINHVIEALIDPEPRVRERALEALYKLGNRVPIQPLIDLAERRGDAQLRAQVAAFVQQFADRAAVSHMTQIRGEDKP